MPPATCRVAYTDPQGIEHAVEVAADSLHEAALKGLVELRASVWAGDRAGVVRVEVLRPSVCHTVPLEAVKKALELPTRTPAELSRQKRIRALWDTLMKNR